MEQEMLYEEQGQMMNVSGLLISLGLGIGVFVVIVIFMSTLSGETFELVEDDIDAISNETIRVYIKDGIAGTFEGQKTLGEYTPLIVLAVVIFLILVLVTQFTGAAGGAAGGSVL